jgi:hypothetical protein
MSGYPLSITSMHGMFQLSAFFLRSPLKRISLGKSFARSWARAMDVNGGLARDLPFAREIGPMLQSSYSCERVIHAIPAAFGLLLRRRRLALSPNRAKHGARELFISPRVPALARPS